jgi:cell division protein FtsL
MIEMSEVTLMDHIVLHPVMAIIISTAVLVMIFAIVYTRLKNRSEQRHCMALEEKLEEIRRLNDALEQNQQKLEEACQKAEACLMISGLL